MNGYASNGRERYERLHTRIGFLEGKMYTLLKLTVASARFMHDVFDGKAPVEVAS